MVVWAMVAWASSSQAADFSGVAGRYKARVTADLMTQVVPGNVSVNVDVPKNGQKATVDISGSLVAGGMVYPIGAKFRFTGKRSYSTDTLLFRISPTSGARGTFKEKGRTITFKAPFVLEGQSGKVKGKISVSKDGKKLELVYVLTADTSAVTYRFTFNGKRKGK